MKTFQRFFPVPPSLRPRVIIFPGFIPAAFKSLRKHAFSKRGELGPHTPIVAWGLRVALAAGVELSASRACACGRSRASRDLRGAGKSLPRSLWVLNIIDLNATSYQSLADIRGALSLACLIGKSYGFTRFKGVVHNRLARFDERNRLEYGC